MSNSKIRVTARVEDKQGELEIVDGSFNVVAEGFGILEAELTPGIYKARASIADTRHEELFVVTPGAGPITIEMESLKFPTPIPLENTSTSHDYHQGALYQATAEEPEDAGLGQGASLLLIVRDPSDANFTQRHSSPEIMANYRRAFDGFRLRDTDGQLLLNFDEVCKADPDWGYVVACVEMNPGFYVLNYEPENGKHVAMPILVVRNWQTQICILVDFPNGLEASGHPNLPDRAIMMEPAGTRFNPNDETLRLTEVARYAFMDGRSIVTNELIDELPKRQLSNPVLELFYAHQLLAAKQPDLNLLMILVDRLTQMLGADFPDVFALRLALNYSRGIKPERIGEPLYPPLLRASWKILAHYPELFPSGSLLSKSAAHLVSRGVWFAWKPFAAISNQKLASLMAKVTSHSSYVAMADLAQQLPLETIFNNFKANVATHGLQVDVPVVRDAIVMLAQYLPWETLFDNFRQEFETHDLMAGLTNLQKSVLPTLQLIHERLKSGGDFSIQEFEQLLEGLHVPLSVLFESLLDLAKQAKVAEHFEEYALQATPAQMVDERQADDDLGLPA